MRAHGVRRRAHQKPQIAPVDRDLVEGEDRLARGQQAVEMLRLEVHSRKGHARLHPPVQLEQLNLQVGRRPEVGLILFQPPELDDLSRLASGRAGEDVPQLRF